MNPTQHYVDCIRPKKKQCVYGPTTIYCVCVSIRFYGLNSWMRYVLDDPIYFMFPILTCISFYNKKTSIGEENIKECGESFDVNKSSCINGDEEEKRNDDNSEDNDADENDYDDVDTSRSKHSVYDDQQTEQEASVNEMKKEPSGECELIEEEIMTFSEYQMNAQMEVCADEEVEKEEQNEDKKECMELSKSVNHHQPAKKERPKDSDADKMLFSKYQSNVLYFLFTLGFVVIVGADLTFQKGRGSFDNVYESNTFPYIIIYVINFSLWIDIINNSDSSRSVTDICTGKYP